MNILNNSVERDEKVVGCLKGRHDSVMDYVLANVEVNKLVKRLEVEENVDLAHRNTHFDTI